MSNQKEPNEKKSPVPLKPHAIRGIAAAACIAIVILLLFGFVGKNWLIAALAALCCFIGVFLCVFGWSYMKAVERYYKAHPELIPAEEPNSSE